MPKPRLKPLLSVVVLIAIAASGFWVYKTYHTESKEPGTKQGEARVPVSIATAERKDFAVYLDSLGEVQAWNTVTVRTRVDGEIVKIAFDEGQFVKQGDLLAQLDPRPLQAALDQANAKQAQDQANLANMRRDLQRFEKAGPLAVTQQQIDTQRSAVSQQESLVKADAGAIDDAKVQLGYTTIKAPISGRVGFRLVDQGNIVHAGDTGGIATIAEIQPIAVIFTEPEEELPRILEQIKAGPLNVVALTSDGKRELGQGELSLVNNQVDTTTGSIKLKAKFQNANKLLWPGLSVSTRLLITTEKNVVVIPDAAVQRGPGKLFAYVVAANNKAELRTLDVGRIQDGEAVINDGVKAGERVVTAGYYRLDAGALVELPESENDKKTATPARATASDGGVGKKPPVHEVE